MVEYSKELLEKASEILKNLQTDGYQPPGTYFNLIKPISRSMGYSNLFKSVFKIRAMKKIYICA